MAGNGAIAHRRLKTALLGGAAAALLASAAMAQDASIRFDIAAQDASSALNDFSRQSGVRVLFPFDAVAGKHVAGLHGDMTVQQALDTLAKATGLTIAANDGQTVTLTAPQSGSAAGDGADGTVQALVVTAQKREEDIQDVPIAISAFTQEDLTRSQVAGGPDLMTQVPNMTFTKTNFSSYSIQIRGIGTQAISATIDPAVAVAFNNTPFIRNHFFEQEFYDLQRVEVLRGPQGTLYGRNATAGVVNLISAKPSYRFEAKASADVSNYSSNRLEGMLNLPLMEDVAALRISGAWTKRAGFVKNLIDGNQTDGRDLWSARVSFRFDPTEWLNANLIYEHFSENDDRLRTGKQLCHKDPGPLEVGGVAVPQGVGYYPNTPGPAWYSLGCNPASLYSPDSYETPNGYTLPYYGPASSLGSPVYANLDPYVSATQSSNLREIETQLKPEYDVRDDVVELQLQFTLPHNLTLVSETGYNHDYIYSFEDFNRFATRPGVFVPGGERWDNPPVPPDYMGSRFDRVDINGVFCDPQLGCSDRLLAGDLDTATSQQFSQEFRLSSDWDGPFNFNLGANYLRYQTEEKYYVFFNTLTAYASTSTQHWIPGVSDAAELCLLGIWEGRNGQGGITGYQWSDPTLDQGVRCPYIDPHDIHHLNDEGRNYFLSKNPYRLMSYSAFGELYYNITPSLKLTSGLRWTVDRKTAPVIPTWIIQSGTYGLSVLKVIDQEWREPTGRLALDWKPALSFTDQTLLYASYAHGYKAGGANPPTPVGFPTDDIGPANRLGGTVAHPERFAAEYVDAYEIGTKNTVLDGKMTFNLGAFYYDYTGYQLSQIVDRSAINLNFDAKIWGAELEADWRPLENLRVGLKGGYENTRLADGSKNIDILDRTAGDPNYIVMRPYPAYPGNCIVPVWFATNYGTDLVMNPCHQYITGEDPAPFNNQHVHLDVSTVPNHGVGILKDISDNELPNAPHYTATITADYTVPMPNDWLATLHTDLYYQSEAWARVFNTPGYDKLKAFSNINLAAIFTNGDAGWMIMAYVKNVLNKDNITGAFLNSDDTGLTTNVFLNEPRLYGLRVTKSWTGSSWWWQAKPGEHQPFRLEANGYYGRFSHDHAYLTPATSLMFAPQSPYPFYPQKDLDWGGGGGVKLTYTPNPGGWGVSLGVRYGKANGDGAAHGNQNVSPWCWTSPFSGDRRCTNPSTGEVTINGEQYVQQYGHPTLYFSYHETTAKSRESHAMVDFMVGKDSGIGSWNGRLSSSNVSGGVSYAHFKSTTAAVMHGRPDLYFAPEIDLFNKYAQAHQHRFTADLFTDREFEGAGPSVQWDGTVRLVGDTEERGELGLDIGLGGRVLFGKQKTFVRGLVSGDYRGGVISPNKYDITPPYEDHLNVARSKSVTVPAVRLNLGLSYAVQGVKVTGGYRTERYYDAVDGGYMKRETYDRTFDGPYFKIAVGFGG